MYTVYAINSMLLVVFRVLNILCTCTCLCIHVHVGNIHPHNLMLLFIFGCVHVMHAKNPVSSDPLCSVLFIINFISYMNMYMYSYVSHNKYSLYEL